MSHAQRVCRLYKKAYRTLECYYFDRALFRYEAVLLRDKFDQTLKETDVTKLAAMLQAGEEEVWKKQHWDPKTFKNDPGGITYQRTAVATDDALDHWHPWEKAPFIDFFEKREQRKKEAIEYYEKVISKKFQADPSTLEYPAKGPCV